MDAADALVAKYSWLGKIGGKRFVSVMIGLFLTVLSGYLKLPVEITVAIVTTIIAYVTGQTITDVKTNGATSDNTPLATQPPDPLETQRIALQVEIEKARQRDAEARRAMHEADGVKETGQLAMASVIKDAVNNADTERLERLRREQASIDKMASGI